MSRHRSSEGAGPSQRQLRVGELVRRTLSDILMRGEVHDADLTGVSITVGEVRVSPDLKVATAYVLPLGGEDVAPTLEALKRNRGEIRRQVAKQTDLKFAPEIRFEADDTFDRMDETRAMFADPDVARDLDD